MNIYAKRIRPTFSEECKKCQFGCYNCRFFNSRKIECSRPERVVCRSRRICTSCDPGMHDKFKPKI